MGIGLEKKIGEIGTKFLINISEIFYNIYYQISSSFERYIILSAVFLKIITFVSTVFRNINGYLSDFLEHVLMSQQVFF